MTGSSLAVDLEVLVTDVFPATRGLVVTAYSPKKIKLLIHLTVSWGPGEAEKCILLRRRGMTSAVVGIYLVRSNRQ
jgi:hypothetical protein